MMIFRECVRRNGRLPQILVMDGGREFESVYFEALLACYKWPLYRRNDTPKNGNGTLLRLGMRTAEADQSLWTMLSGGQGA